MNTTKWCVLQVATTACLAALFPAGPGKVRTTQAGRLLLYTIACTWTHPPPWSLNLRSLAEALSPWTLVCQ